MRNPNAKVTVVFQMSRNDGGLDQGFTVATPRSIQEFEEMAAGLRGLRVVLKANSDLPRIVSGANVFAEMQERCQSSIPWAATLALIMSALLLTARLWGQTDCEAGNGLLDFTQPKSMSVEEIIRRFGAAESGAKQARLHYTFKQEVLMQTLSGKDVTGEFHEVTNISYDEKGRRKEEVTFAAQNSLRGIQLTTEDMEDIRVFMPLLLPDDDLPQYGVTYGTAACG